MNVFSLQLDFTNDVRLRYRGACGANGAETAQASTPEIIF